MTKNKGINKKMTKNRESLAQSFIVFNTQNYHLVHTKSQQRVQAFDDVLQNIQPLK